MIALELLLWVGISTRVGTAVDNWTPPLQDCVPAPLSFESCRNQDNGFRCAVLLEACLMRNEPGFAERDDATLSLRLDDGSWRRFTDLVPLSAEYGTLAPYELQWKGYYSLVDYDVVADRYVVQVQFHESQVFLVVDPGDGRALVLRGRPQFSPDGNRIAVLSGAHMFGLSSVEIWRWEEGDAVREFQLHRAPKRAIEEFEILEPYEWEDDSTYAFLVRHRRRGEPPRDVLESIRRDGNGWIATEGPAPE